MLELKRVKEFPDFFEGRDRSPGVFRTVDMVFLCVPFIAAVILIPLRFICSDLFYTRLLLVIEALWVPCFLLVQRLDHKRRKAEQKRHKLAREYERWKKNLNKLPP